MFRGERARTVKLVIIAFVFSLIIAEALVRYSFPQMGWGGKQYDDLGWAGNEYLNFAPTEDNRDCSSRILVLGGAYLRGEGVDSLDQRLTNRLERKLKGVCVVTLASGMWGTDQQFLALKAKGLHWKPDIVILAITARHEIAANLSNFPNKPYFMINEKKDLVLHNNDGTIAEGGQQNSGATAISPWQSYALNLVRFRGSRALEILRIHTSKAMPEWLKNYIRKLIPGAERETISADGKKVLRGDQNVDERYRIFFRNEYKGSPHGIFGDVDSLLNVDGKLPWAPEKTVSPLSAYIHEDFSLNKYAWELTGRILEKIRDTVAANGGKFLIMTHPDTLLPDDIRFITGSDYEKFYTTPEGGFLFRAAEPVDRLARISDTFGLMFFNPMPKIIQRIKTENLVKKVWPRDNVHYSALGHELVSQALADFLSSNFNLVLAN